MLGDDHPDTLWSFYNVACSAALQGNREKALDSLRRAMDNGFTDADWMMKDSELVSLHGDPEFEAIVAEIKKRVGEE